jgi:hypothetical protein
MLQVAKLLRLVENRRHGQVVDEVLRNGRPLPVAVRARLADAANVRLAALGLALQRTVELAYAPTADAETLAHEAVAAWQTRAAGAVAGTGEPSAAAIAMLIAGLCDLLALAEASGGASGGVGGGGGCDLAPGLSGRIRAVVREACYELSAAQAGSAVREPRNAGLVGDGLDSVVVSVWNHSILRPWSERSGAWSCGATRFADLCSRSPALRRSAPLDRRAPPHEPRPYFTRSRSFGPTSASTLTAGY